MIRLRLKSGREKSVLRRHPWIFASAIENLDGNPQDGETVQVLDSKGDFLAWGAVSLKSQIRLRLWSWKEQDIIEADFFRSRLQQSLAIREDLLTLRDAQAARLVYAESDNLPGFIADRYSDVIVVQVLSSGAERWRDDLVELLVECTGTATIFERSDVDVRRLEGLPSRTGSVFGSEPPDRILIHENNMQFWVDIRQGHKTGFYLDQRQNRHLVRNLAAGKRVLDCFCYTGGFTIASLMGGAHTVVAVDSSAPALELAAQHLELNNLSPDRVTFLHDDVFQQLREYRDRGEKFDLIILDPPKFAPTASQVQRAARAYKDINLLAFKLLEPGGYLVTFSCSGGVDLSLFQKIVAGAALDAGVEAQILEHLFQAPDHPVALNFPEGAYLKGFVIRRITSLP